MRSGGICHQEHPSFRLEHDPAQYHTFAEIQIDKVDEQHFHYPLVEKNLNSFIDHDKESQFLTPNKYPNLNQNNHTVFGSRSSQHSRSNSLIGIDEFNQSKIHMSHGDTDGKEQKYVEYLV